MNPVSNHTQSGPLPAHRRTLRSVFIGHSRQTRAGPRPRPLASRWRSITATALVALLCLPLGPALAASPKVLVCHMPPGNPTNTQIIEVGFKAAMKHVQLHGDSLVDEAGERCDGIDNTCDGFIDEGFDVGAECAEGLGECVSTGLLVCDDRGDGTVCDAEIVDPPGARCDLGPGYDGNCNGVPDVDEDACMADPCAECEEALIDGLELCEARRAPLVAACHFTHDMAVAACPPSDAFCLELADIELESCLLEADFEFFACEGPVQELYQMCRIEAMCP